jgi:hypothetical protein
VQSGGLEFLVAKISRKMSNSQMCCRDAPIGQDTAEFLRQMHPKSFQHHVCYIGYAFYVLTNFDL